MKTLLVGVLCLAVTGCAGFEQQEQEKNAAIGQAYANSVAVDEAQGKAFQARFLQRQAARTSIALVAHCHNIMLLQMRMNPMCPDDEKSAVVFGSEAYHERASGFSACYKNVNGALVMHFTDARPKLFASNVYTRPVYPTQSDTTGLPKGCKIPSPEWALPVVVENNVVIVR